MTPAMALRIAGRRYVTAHLRELHVHSRPLRSYEALRASGSASTRASDSVSVSARSNASKSLPQFTPRRYASATAAQATKAAQSETPQDPTYEPYMVPTYVRPPPIMTRGQGCYIWDADGRRYLDLMAGIAVNALGHADPAFIKVLTEQASTLMHASNLYYNAWAGKLSQLLVDVTRASGGMHNASKVFICNSGTEANEAAIKFARKVGKVRDPSGAKHEIVSFQQSFHGRTMGALSATPNAKYQAPFAPMLPGFRYGEYNNVEAVQDLVTEQTCGVIIEPIQGEGGVNVATPEFLQALRDRCNAVGAVLIYDEIQCGLGRTGKFWLHSALPPSAHPDIVTTAKALGNGYPVGATMVTEEVAQCIVTGDHGTTFGGSPMASRIAHHIVTRLANPELQQHIVAMSQVFQDRFAQLRQKHPKIVKEVRGRGLLLGLQLDRSPAPLITAARERGLLIISAGVNTVRFAPPLIISREQVNTGMDILEEAMDEVVNSDQTPPGTPGQQEMAGRET